MGKPTMEYLQEQGKIRKAKEEQDILEKKRIELSIYLDICPVCGSSIIEEKQEVYDKPKKFLLGLITIRYYNWDYRKICSIDKSHYEGKWNWASNSGQDY